MCSTAPCCSREQSASGGLSFVPTQVGVFSSLYRIVTDVNADLGAHGDPVIFQLTGRAVAAVPEPSQWLMMVLGLGGLWAQQGRLRARSRG